ncbi:dsDNA nuclease domain-containing protein [Larkinella rosea]|uniref:DUF4297 domain-containing protein n=1 Tax=Larkinella rosea TaxID=2025312 RepID=A0A3P1BYX6_9BACT|nr:dsDNA nuclease domain-containing protein [Larkinella rosea]RRB06301.1 DUF4297 domain-containing protein [Larkinella rosea]
MNLEHALISIKPREVSGSRVDERYFYQKDVSLFTMVEYYNSMDNFVFLFDFHDDLAILDSDIAPTRIQFFQIKSKSKGSWTTSSLIKSDKKQSFLSKLYSNKVLFGDYLESMYFISNARYNIKLENGDESESKFEINAIDINKNDINKINLKIKEELSLHFNPEFEKNTFFKVSKLSLVDSKGHCKGALCELLNLINPGNFPNINLTYDKILNEIRIKTDCVLSDYEIKDLKSAINKKGISKGYFTKLLIAACPYKNFDLEWNEIENKLLSCNIGYASIKKIKVNFRELYIQSLYSQSDIPFSKVIEFVKECVKKIYNLNNGSTEKLNYFDLSEHIYNMYYQDLPYKHFDPGLIKAMVLKYLNNE